MLLPFPLRAAALALVTTLSASCSTAHAPPDLSVRPKSALLDVEVVDRTNGQTLPVYWFGGERWIAGTPGHRYSIVLRNRSGGRVLGVIAVDGVNAVSGETAAWDQTGYVLNPGQGGDIRGWRKSADRIAAFEFTALSNSYAARTGRPANVGVIGVAVFREQVRAEMLPATPLSSRDKSTADAAPAEQSAGAAAPPAAPAARADGRSETRELARNESRIGTGHGRSETSRVSFTDFERARAEPDEVITLRYDSRENLIAMGVLPRFVPQPGVPRPFPNSELGFVPDPPR